MSYSVMPEFERAPTGARLGSVGLPVAPLVPPIRVLLAPGPVNLPPEVIAALRRPIVGPEDPFLLQVMDEIVHLLRYVYQTENHATMALPGSGGAAMEAALANLVEPGAAVVVCVNGMFGMRMAEIAARHGGTVHMVTAPWGKPIDPGDVRKAMHATGAKVVTVVHGETSTGVEQPLAEIGAIARTHDALLVVDGVATLGGMAVVPDEWGSAICYSGSQKCLSAPPGLATMTISDEAMQRIRRRRSPVENLYFDLDLHRQHWFGDEHPDDHAPPVLMMYALHEALRLIVDEGLDDRFARHRLVNEAVVGGLEALGIELFADEGYRLPTVVSVLVPEGISDAQVRSELLNEFGIEISGGLGEFAGRMWRIGVMGHSARPENMLFLLAALESILARQGYGPGADTAVRAADAVLARARGEIPKRASA